MTEPLPRPALRIKLPGVVSWSRPRRQGGRVRYPPAYVRAREAWSLVVAHAVHAQDWCPPSTSRYQVSVVVCGGGRRDLDRVCTAALDALQAGGAVRDDCLVDELAAIRSRAPRGSRPATVVAVSALPARPTVQPCPTHAPARPAGTKQTEEHHAR